MGTPKSHNRIPRPMIFLLHITGCRSGIDIRSELNGSSDVQLAEISAFRRSSKMVNGTFLVQFPGRCFSARPLSGSFAGQGFRVS